MDACLNQTNVGLKSAEIQIMSGDEAEVKAGILDVGDAIGFFEADVDISKGDKVVYNNETWRVIGVYPEKLGTVTIYKEVHLKKEVK